jgi:hypothetical protein
MGSRKSLAVGEVGERERERSLKRGQWFRGLNTLGPTPSRTLSRPARHCLVRTFWLGRIAHLRFFRNFEVGGLHCD